MQQRRAEAPGLPVQLGPRLEMLVGRERLLTELDARLTGAPGEGPRTVALCGLGGAGKTSVAIEYAHRHMPEVGICWQFAAEDQELLAAQFEGLAAQLGVRDLVDTREPVASVHAVLARAQQGWLVIFDNAPDLASVQRFLPPSGPGRVVITSQNQHWPPGQVLDVPVFDVPVAADFLVSRTGEADQGTARELAEELGGLALALEQAAAFMRATGTTLARYLRLFREQESALLARGEVAGHPADVATTLGLTLSRLAEEDPAAAGLIRLMAFLAPEPVPLGLLLSDGGVGERLDTQVKQALGPLLGNPIALWDAIAALRQYSLVTLTGDGVVLMHRLVRSTTRHQLPPGMTKRWQRATRVLVNRAIPANVELPASWLACAALLPHVREVLPPTSGGLGTIASYLGSSGSYLAARDLCQLILGAREAEEAFGPEHPDTLSTRHNLALWTGVAGDPATARDQLTALLPICERVLGPEHPDTLTNRHKPRLLDGAG